jgi:hypothetical protein
MVDNSAPNIQNTSSQRLILPNDFYVPEWRGKEVFVDMTFVSKECKLGEVVMVDYTGYLLDQETLERIPDDKGGYKTFDTGIGVQFFLGAHLAIEDFEAGIVGIKINESKSFNVTFPSDYFSEELKGQKAQFEVKVTKIYTPPVYNDEFVKEKFEHFLDFLFRIGATFNIPFIKRIQKNVQASEGSDTGAADVFVHEEIQNE